MDSKTDKLEQWRNNPAYALLKAEVASLRESLPEGEAITQLLHSGLERLQAKGSEDDLLTFYEHILDDMRDGSFHHVVPTDPNTEADRVGISLISLGKELDHRFAEVRALSEVTTKINQGLFLEDVLTHVYDTFRILIPYDRIGFALIEPSPRGPTVRAHWAKSDFPHVMIYKNYTLPMTATSLGAVAEAGLPRIINDLDAYLEEHPHSASTRRILHEGAHSSLTCPLIVKGKVTGFMFFSSRNKDAYHQGHVEVFQELAGQMAVTLEKSRLYEELTSRNQFIRKVFGQYVSDDVAEVLLSSPDALKLGGKKQIVTIMMTDLRGFTKMSEHKPPEVVVAALNTHLEHMVPIIKAHGGTIDNIIGDAIMVLFGTPLPRPDDAQRAVACALAMQREMAEVNDRNQHQGLPELAMGIGINTGSVIVGNIGSEAHMKYSVIGSPVNLASRIESHSKGGEVLVSGATLQDVKGCVVDHSRDIVVKGFSHVVTVHCVTSLGP